MKSVQQEVDERSNLTGTNKFELLLFRLGGDANGFYYFGGTSAGSPQWAALTADTIQAVGHTVGNVSGYAPGWAAKGILYDVTQGSNITPTYTGGYSATAGWDRPTGWGTPDVGRIIADLK